MSDALVLPEPRADLAFSVNNALEIERQVTSALPGVTELALADEGRLRVLALERWQRGKEQQAPLRGAARRIEARIGQLLGEPQPGRRTDLEPPNRDYEVDLHDPEIRDFRLLGRALAGECEITDEEWRQTRQALVKEVRKRLGVEIKVAPPTGTYSTLVVDPPWPIKKIEREERVNQDDIDYAVMDEDELRAWPVVKDHAADDAHLYLWTTHRHLPLALQLVEVWGFKYQCLLTWRKNVGITPFSWMYSTEHVVFARRGNLELLEMGRRLDFEAKVLKHSAKPDVFYELVRDVSPGPRIDLFARAAHPGFTAWGLEAPNA